MLHPTLSTVPYAVSDSLLLQPKIEHAGYRRHIIARNPPLIDEDGDEIEEVDDDESVDGSIAEDNPYGDIRLEGAHLQCGLARQPQTDSQFRAPRASYFRR